MGKWLSPARRKAIHDTVPMLTAVLVFVGILSDVQAYAIGGAAIALADCVVAIFVTKSGIRVAVYAVCASSASILVVWGIMSQQLAQLIMSALMGVIGVFLAGANTDVATPDGTPSAELELAYADQT